MTVPWESQLVYLAIALALAAGVWVALRVRRQRSGTLPGSILALRSGPRSPQTEIPTLDPGSAPLALYPEPSDPEPVDLRDELQRALGSAYEVGGAIGEGGFGVVLSVRDLGLKRDLACKVIRRTHLRDTIDRFQREAVILARLRHAHIVPVHFVGSTPGIVFMAMPRIVGLTLRDLLKEHRVRVKAQPLPFDEIARILQEIAGALDEAHASNIIHRDIKPENILLEDPRGSVQVVDFGLARLVDPQLPPRLGTVVGTWLYMSPEQWTGDPGIDLRSDVYSLGCVVYEMIAGHSPFEQGFAPGGPFRYRSAHLHEPPPALRNLRLDCGAATERVVLTALAKSKEDRFAGAGAFARAFADSLA